MNDENLARNLSIDGWNRQQLSDCLTGLLFFEADIYNLKKIILSGCVEKANISLHSSSIP